jgi:hypothetical protein
MIWSPLGRCEPGVAADGRREVPGLLQDGTASPAAVAALGEPLPAAVRPGAIVVDTVVVRVQAGEDARPRRAAEGRGEEAGGTGGAVVGRPGHRLRHGGPAAVAGIVQQANDDIGTIGGGGGG